MHLDVLDLRDFYASPLGSVARRVIGNRVRASWGRTNGQTVVGIGYAPPFIGNYRAPNTRLIALMPAAQGALVWPTAAAVHTVMADEQSLPLPDNSVDKILAIHCLEVSEHARSLMRELWRVLAPEGRLLLVVPNRHGPWSRRDATPFGQGQPYSRAQLQKLLTDTLFSPVTWTGALHTPPFNRGFVLRRARMLERFGTRYWPGIAGVHIVEARKQLEAPVPAVRAARRVTKLSTASPAVRTRTFPRTRN